MLGTNGDENRHGLFLSAITYYSRRLQAHAVGGGFEAGPGRSDAASEPSPDLTEYPGLVSSSTTGSRCRAWFGAASCPSGFIGYVTKLQRGVGGGTGY